MAALMVHLTVPFAHIVVQDEAGAVIRDDVVGLFEWQGERDAAASSTVARGAGFEYMLVSLVFMAVGALAFAFLGQRDGTGRSGWFQLGAGTLTAVGAAMTIHNQGLWAGRGFNAGIQKLMGWDNPPQDWATFIHDYSSADVATYLTTISPAIVVALTIALIGVLAKTWSGMVRTDRDMHVQAWHHGRLALIGAAVFVLLTVMPWVVTVMPGSVQPDGAEVPDDTFFWSAYDVLWMNDMTRTAAEDLREGGLVIWDDLAALLDVLMLTSLVAIIAPFAGLAGKHMESLKQPVFGRLIESTSLATVLVHPFTVVAALLASFMLHDPSDIFPAKTTGVAMLAAVGGIAASVFAFLIARVVVADETGIIADDFPEPVVYD